MADFGYQTFRWTTPQEYQLFFGGHVTDFFPDSGRLWFAQPRNLYCLAKCVCLLPSRLFYLFRLYMASHKRVHTTAASRLRQDYLRIVKDPVPYITALPLPSNILEWLVQFSIVCVCTVSNLAFCHSFVLLDLFSIVSLSKVLFHSLCRHYVVRGPENTPYTGKTIWNQACKGWYM